MSERLAKSENVVLNSFACAGGRHIGPQRVDDRVNCDGIGSAEQEQDEDGTLAARCECDGVLSVGDLKWSQNAVFHARGEPTNGG